MERLARKIIHESRWVNLYVDTVRMPQGEIIEDYHMLHFPQDAVTTVVEDAQGKVVFAKIQRYTSGTNEWELPAGGIEIGEGILEAARREVREETGFDSHNHRLIYTYFPQNGSGDKVFHVVFCQVGEKVQDFDLHEVSDICWRDRAEIERVIDNHETTDGYTLNALLLWLREKDRPVGGI